MSDPRNPDDEIPAVPLRAKQIQRELESRIILMEAALGSVHQAEAVSGVDRRADKVDLRKKLTVCYVARDGMRRGSYLGVRDLTTLLLRIQTQIDHESFRKLGPVTAADIKATDIADLGRRLAASGA